MANTLPDITIILPCLNEELGICHCLDQIQALIDSGVLDSERLEVLVVNNGSTDKTPSIVEDRIRAMGASSWLTLLDEPVRGYGSAYLRGLNAAQGKNLFMADADGTYDFKDIPRFMSALDNGADMVIGNRFANGLAKDTMPWMNRHIGNPILSFVTRLFFGIRIHDIHCGARAMTRAAFERITLHTTGMEFASEMIIKAAKAQMSIAEIPIVYAKRIGTSKLRSFADGWRHLRFILLYSPLILFLLPGSLLFAVGTISLLTTYFSVMELSAYPMFLSAVTMILGYQLIFFGGFAKTYAITHLGDTNLTLQSMFRYLTIEKAGLAGIILTIIGMTLYLSVFAGWQHGSQLPSSGALSEIKNSVVALTLSALGMQTFFSAFMLSIIGIQERK